MSSLQHVQLTIIEQDVNVLQDMKEMVSPDVNRYAKENVNMMWTAQTATLVLIISVSIHAEFTTHVERKLFAKHHPIDQCVAVQAAGQEIHTNNVSNTNVSLTMTVHSIRLV